MDNLPSAHINCHMTGIADNVTWLGILIAHFTSCPLQCHRTVWQADSKVGINALDKSGTVRSIGETLAAPYIRVSNKLAGIRYDITSTY